MLNQRLLILAIALGLWLCVPSAASAVPANDNFANATALSGSNVSTAGDNIGATAEAGEPNHAGNASAHSVWWSWTAPSTGRFVIDTCDFNTVDTVLAVYTGNTLAALSEVASSDDANE